jgi:hypothetical protein
MDMTICTLVGLKYHILWYSSSVSIEVISVGTTKLSIFLRNFRDCKAVALKEYYNYSPISTCTEKS